jgi:hypothetical protein
MNNGTATLYKDGAQVAQWTHTYNTVLSRLVMGQEIGKNKYVGMDVAALLVYNRALNQSEIAEVDAYLRNKYIASFAAPASFPVEVGGGGVLPSGEELALSVYEFNHNVIRLRCANLRPTGNYHLHAVADLSSQSISDPRYRIATLTSAQIEAMEPEERAAFIFDCPVTEGSRFFRLFFEEVK